MQHSKPMLAPFDQLKKILISQTLLEKGEIPDAGATKKRKAEDEEAAAAQVCYLILSCS